MKKTILMIFLLSSFLFGQLRVDSLKADHKIFLPVGGLQDSTVQLSDFTTAAYNFIGSGGSITNNPDDVTLENKSGETIGIKSAKNEIVVAASDASTVSKAIADYECDGTNDEVQILAAVTALESIGGGVLELSAGTFFIDADCWVESSNITLKGQGIGATVWDVSNGDEYGFKGVKNPVITGITIDGMDDADSWGLNFDNCEDIIVDNIRVSRTGQHLLQIHGVNRGMVTNSFFVDSTYEFVSGDHGVDFDVDNTETYMNRDIVFSNNFVLNNTHEALKLENTYDIMITDNIFYSRVSMEDISEFIQIQNVLILNNTFHVNPSGSDSRAIYLTAMDIGDVLIAGNRMDSTWVMVNIDVADTNSYVTVRDNIFTAAYEYYAIQVYGNNNLSIIDNEIYYSTCTKPIYITNISRGVAVIANNKIVASSGQTGIDVDSISTTCDITGNYITGTTYGMYISKAKNTRFMGNKYENMTTGVVFGNCDSIYINHDYFNGNTDGFQADTGFFEIKNCEFLNQADRGIEATGAITTFEIGNYYYNNVSDRRSTNITSVSVPILYLKSDTVYTTNNDFYIKSNKSVHVFLDDNDNDTETGYGARFGVMNSTGGYSFRAFERAVQIGGTGMSFLDSVIVNSGVDSLCLKIGTEWYSIPLTGSKAP